MKNDKYVCQGKWKTYLETHDYSKYGNIILTNDSFLITRSLEDYKRIINPATELSALLDSYQLEYHYPDFLRAYNQAGIKKILNHYATNMDKIYTFNDCINFFEVAGTALFENVNILYKNHTKHVSNIHFFDIATAVYLYDMNYPVIKIKKLTSNSYTEVPQDFNPIEYKEVNPELCSFDEKELTSHFMDHGIYQGKLYKKNQKPKLPEYLEKYLEKIGFSIPT